MVSSPILSTRPRSKKGPRCDQESIPPIDHLYKGDGFPGAPPYRKILNKNMDFSKSQSKTLVHFSIVHVLDMSSLVGVEYFFLCFVLLLHVVSFPTQFMTSTKRPSHPALGP